jgi:hypothetical protein
MDSHGRTLGFWVRAREIVAADAAIPETSRDSGCAQPESRQQTQGKAYAAKNGAQRRTLLKEL